MQFAVDVGTFIGHEAARLSLNEQTKSRQFVNHVASVIHEDLNRLRLGQPTVLGSRLLNEFRVLADMSAPELARNLGADLGNALVLYGIGNGLRVANQSANSFIMAHEFRSPVTFRFEAGRLNSANLAKNNLLFSSSAKMDLAAIGYLDGQLYPTDKLPILNNYLHKRGVDVITITRGSPAFQAVNPLTGRSTLYLPNSPTVLQIKHELSHWLDCKELGVEKYSKLTVFEKEQMVLNRLKNKKRFWEQLTDKERDFSKAYVDGLRPDLKLASKNGVKNVE